MHAYKRTIFYFHGQDITQESKTLKFQKVSYKEIMGTLKKLTSLPFT
jgi:hypothetical protein